METCLRIIGDGTETDLDILLALQVKCQLLGNFVNHSSMREAETEMKRPFVPFILQTSLIKQLADLESSLPNSILTLSL